MKERIISAIKFIGLHILVGLIYVISFMIDDYINLYRVLESSITNIHLLEWISVGFLDTLMTLAIIDKFNVFKGKCRIIKTWIAWLIGIIIAYYSCGFIVMLYWLI